MSKFFNSLISRVAEFGGENMPNLKEIEKGLNSNLGCECLAAAKACKNMRISEGKILNWIDAKRWPWRLAAIYACFNKQEMDLSVVEKGITVI